MTADDNRAATGQPNVIIFDPANRVAVQAIALELGKANQQKFMQFEITEVKNPKKIRISFTVHYQREGGEKILLGTFGLFPPDNPGTFVVPTGGKLQSDGSIFISMEMLDDIAATDELRVTMKEIALISQLRK